MNQNHDLKILDLPIEIQENILVNIDTNTKLESVCLLWNEICKKNVIKNVRIPCVCTKSPHHAMVCNGMGHPCICIGSPHHALRCRGINHPCICIGGTHHAWRCRWINHPCIYNGNLNYDLNCKSPNHININVY
tara:strand:- start:158 stop:559 length:402 start_codon:yes stop_codon:yes gene_type:complete